MSKQIKLTKGMTAIVDDEDYERLSSFKWFFMGNKYAARNIRCDNGKQRPLWMHREIINASEGMQVDHINGNKLDNRRENLRLCTQSQNLGNRTYSGDFSSKYKGVSFSKKRNKWTSGIRINTKRIYLGLYEDEVVAANAYNHAARRLFGEFSLLNDVPFIEEKEVILLSSFKNKDIILGGKY
jgi:hypothetical protein